MKSHCKTVTVPIKTLINVLVEEKLNSLKKLFMELIENDNKHKFHDI